MRDDLPLPAALKVRRQVRSKLHDIRAYIEDQRGNDPEDTTGWKVLEEIFANLFFIRRYPWSGKQVRDLSKNYRQRRVAASHLIYYYVNDEANKVSVIDIRHKSQQPLKPSTLRKYKGEIPD